MAKGGRPRTKELYNATLAAFRHLGNQPGKVAQVVGVHRGTARGLYERGWPDREGCGPIKQQLEMDNLLIRAVRAGADPTEQVNVAQQVLTTAIGAARESALDSAAMLAKASLEAQAASTRAQATLVEAQKKLAEVEELAISKVSDAEKQAQATLLQAEIDAKQKLAELLQKAKVDVAETLADEAHAAKFGRKAALAAVAIAALVLNNAQGIAADAREAITGKFKGMDPLKVVRVLRELTRLVEAAEKSLILALQAERLRLGQPTEVLGIMGMGEESSFEEEEIQLRALVRAHEKEKSKLKLVQGGADAAGPAGATGAVVAGAPGPGGVAGGSAA